MFFYKLGSYKKKSVLRKRTAYWAQLNEATIGTSALWLVQSLQIQRIKSF